MNMILENSITIPSSRQTESFLRPVVNLLNQGDASLGMLHRSVEKVKRGQVIGGWWLGLALGAASCVICGAVFARYKGSPGRLFRSTGFAADVPNTQNQRETVEYVPECGEEAEVSDTVREDVVGEKLLKAVPYRRSVYDRDDDYFLHQALPGGEFAPPDNDDNDSSEEDPNGVLSDDTLPSSWTPGDQDAGSNTTAEENEPDAPVAEEEARPPSSSSSSSTLSSASDHVRSAQEQVDSGTVSASTSSGTINRRPPLIRSRSTGDMDRKDAKRMRYDSRVPSSGISSPSTSSDDLSQQHTAIGESSVDPQRQGTSQGDQGCSTSSENRRQDGGNGNGRNINVLQVNTTFNIVMK